MSDIRPRSMARQIWNAQRKKLDAVALRKNLREKAKRTLPKLKELRNARKNMGSVAPKRIKNRAQAHESRIYSEYALLYDKTFGKVFYDRIRQIIESLKIPPGALVLELGVGTGTSFRSYPPPLQDYRG
jgi:tRNA A58 N-methylase Trm61